MTDGNEPINATTVYTDKQLPHTGDVIRYEDHYAGLTKREYFAAMAMQGMLSSGCYYGENSQFLSDIEGEAKPRCSDAVAWADKLIEALNKQP